MFARIMPELLSYCSPSRAGEHEVEIEAVAEGTSGRLAYRFNATGFGPNCDPNQKPSFDVHHPKPQQPPKVAERAPEAPPPSHAKNEDKGSSPIKGWAPKR